jgi:large subunit ribosomal protein L4
MAHVSLLSPSGASNGTVELTESVFGVQPNVPVMHQVVTAQLAKRRAGTQSTKTRSEVSGGGKKPFKQKGTGNARQGSTRAPQWPGGGIALGPKPRKYAQRTPKKMVQLALRSALSDRAMNGKVVVVDSWNWSAPSTKAAVKSLKDLNVTGSALVVVDRDDENAIKSFRNLQNVQLVERAELNAYDVLCNDFVVFSSATLPGEESTAPKVRTVRLARLGSVTPLGTDTSAASAPKAKSAAKAKPAAASAKPAAAPKPAAEAAPVPKPAAEAAPVAAPVVEAAPVALADTSSATTEKAKVTRKVTIRTIVDGVETVEELEEEVEMVDADSIVDHNPDTIDTHTRTTTETIVDGKVVSHTETEETEEHK